MSVKNSANRLLGSVAVIAGLVLAGCGGSATKGAGTIGQPLDNAIKQAAALISERVEAGTKIALLNFKSPADRFSEYFINELEASLLDHGKLTVIDRKEIDLIRGEMEFQMSGEVSDESIQMAGQKLGAQSIVSGQLMEIGDTYRMVVRVLNVETAAVAAQYRDDVRNDDRVRALLMYRNDYRKAAQAQAPRQQAAAAAVQGEGEAQGEVPMVAEGPGASSTTAVKSDAVSASGKKAPAVNPNKVYKVGDVGPAGGLIFYDKGDNVDGWRYLEAAPVETEKKFAWWIQRHLKDFPGKGDFSVGKGKENTQELMNYVNENCGIYNTELPAIHYCSTLEFNGYKDWFLPSKDELHLMRQKLHIMGLGKFSNEERYWSSNITWWNYDTHVYYVGFKFNDGDKYRQNHNNIYLVRPARRF